MMMSGSRLRQFGWLVVLAACVALFLALSFRVHAVKSEVLLAEREIIDLEQERLMLETEVQTRASQRQLAEWNVVEFGYAAPRADQYLASERQLASLGSPVGPTAPRPIRVAMATTAVDSGGEEIVGDAAAGTPRPEDRPMVSPLTGQPVTLAAAAPTGAGESFADAFGELIAEAAPVSSAQARTVLSAEIAE